MRLYAYCAPPSSLSLICPGWCAYTPITPHPSCSVYFVPGGALIRLLRPTLVAQFNLSRVVRLYAYYAPPSSLSLLCPGLCAYTPITPHLRRSVYFVPGCALIRLLRPTLVAQFTLSRVVRLYAYYAPPSSLSLICPGLCAYTPITPHLRRSVYFVPGGALIRLLRPTLVAQFNLSRVVRLYAYYAPS